MLRVLVCFLVCYELQFVHSRKHVINFAKSQQTFNPIFVLNTTSEGGQREGIVACKKANANLAVIDSLEKQKFATNILKKSSACWLLFGLERSGEQFTWHGHLDKPLNHTAYWKFGQPKMSKENDCVLMGKCNGEVKLNTWSLNKCRGIKKYPLCEVTLTEEVKEHLILKMQAKKGNKTKTGSKNGTVPVGSGGSSGGRKGGGGGKNGSSGDGKGDGDDGFTLPKGIPGEGNSTVPGKGKPKKSGGGGLLTIIVIIAVLVSILAVILIIKKRRKSSKKSKGKSRSGRRKSSTKSKKSAGGDENEGGEDKDEEDGDEEEEEEEEEEEDED